MFELKSDCEVETKEETGRAPSFIQRARSCTTPRLPSFSHATYMLVALTTALIFANHFVLDPDPNKCQALTSSGNWYGDSWIGRGCSAIRYGGDDMDRCTNGRDRRITFAGDVHSQGIFYSMVHKLDKDFEIPELEEKDKDYRRNKIHLEFIYDPYLNGSRVIKRAEDMRDRKGDSAMLAVFGAGQKFVEQNAQEEYIKTVSSLADTVYSGKLPRVPLGSNKVFTEKDGPGDLLLFAPVQKPRKDKKHEKTDFAAYDHANDLLGQVKDISVLWSFEDMMDQRTDSYMDDGYHVKSKVSDRQAELLLNLRCNAGRGRRGNFPNLAICCSVWHAPNWQQMGFLILGLAVLPAIVLVDLRFPILGEKARPVVRAFFFFTAVVSFQYITDRTHIFEQTTRFSLRWHNLRSMLIFTLIVGALTIRRSPSPRKPPNSDKVPNHPFLPRDQSNEWKGWMQAFIIIYHYNEANSLPWFWYIIRLCVSSYLFLTGFGHTIYFLQKNDYSAKRFVNIMIRTNLLPVALAYVQRTRWQLYYYMPLATFWFAVVYVTMAVRSEWNKYTPFLVAKIVLVAAAVHKLINMEDLYKAVVKIFGMVFKISFDAKEFFHHRVDMDQYIVFVGMGAAIVYLWMRDVLDPTKRKDVFAHGFRILWPGFKWCLVLACGFAFSYFFYYVDYKFDGFGTWTKWQPYITFIPILTGLALRNAHPIFRNWHSTAFAFLGKYSGEMYVMQDHLWLAGDQEAVLRTGFFHGDETLFGDRWRDLVFITPIYLVGCMLVGNATGVIADWFVKVEPRAPSAALSVARTPASEMERGLLSGDADSEDAESMDEKAARPVSRWRVWWQTLKSGVQQVIWPDSARDRGILLLLVLWILNLTYT